MRSKRRFIKFALIIPIVVGIAIGIPLGDMLYDGDVAEFERASGRPFNHGDHVLPGYTLLTLLATTLVGLMIGIFLYGFLRNRHSEQTAGLRIRGSEPL